MKRLIIYSILSVATLCSYGQSNFNKTEIKSTMKRVADWQIANPATGAEHDDLNWTYAALYMGMIDWAELTEKEDGDSQYYNWLLKIGRRNAWQMGKYMYHADFIAVGQVFLEMHQKYNDRNMMLPTLARTEFVINHPSASTLELDYRNMASLETPWPQLLELYKLNRGMKKRDFLRLAADTLDCLYLPERVNVRTENGRTVEVRYEKKVKKHKEKNLDESFFPKTALVPNLEIVHDRAVAELFRGCANGCRFCQAGFIYRPVRERSPDTVVAICRSLLLSTGYDELSLNSLSTGDYSGLKEIVARLKPFVKERGVKLSLPSLRMDSFDGETADTERKSSLTFAPEAGTQRLRDVINKNITEENIFNTLAQAFERGYSSVKFYFMLGLPTETDEDVEGIVNLAAAVKKLYRERRTSGKELRLSISAATFIPKPFTPFQ